MAEVKLSVTGKDVITYTDNAALITASIAPPSMTFVDQNPQVTMAKDPVVVMTYKENSEIEIEGPMRRQVYMDVELDGYLKRNIDSDDPFKMILQGYLSRNVTNTVELEAQLVRNVLSYNVGLDYGLRRVVTNTVELEGNLSRSIIGHVELEGRLTRVVISDDDVKEGIPEKKYEAFIDQNKLFRVQHDVLDEDVSDNPYFEKQVSTLQNAALLTKNQTVIKAINELFINQRAIFETTFNAFKKFDNKLGDLVSDKELNEKYKALGYRNIIDAVVTLNDSINNIIDFIGSQTHDLNEMGYDDLVDGLQQLNDRIKEITFEYEDITQEQVEWVFKPTYYIPDIKDTVFNILDAMDDQIKTFEQKVTDKFIDLKIDTENTINAYYLSILNDFDNTTKEEIKEIFYNHLDESGEIADEDPLTQLIVQLGYQIADHKDEVRRSITALSDEMHDYVEMTEHDIRRIFREIDESTGEEVIFYEDQIIEELSQIKDRLTELESLYTTDIDSIRADINTRIGDLINAHNADITRINQTIESTKNTLESSITSKTTQLESSLNTKINTLESKHETDIETLTTTINTTKTDLEELRSLDLANIRDEIDTKIEEVETKHEADINSINQSISDTRSELDNLINLDLNNIRSEVETKIEEVTSAHNRDIASINTSIGSLRSELEAIHGTDVSTIREDITNLSTKIDTTKANLESTINTKINELETKHDSDIQTVTNTITELETKHDTDVSNLNGFITSTKENLEEAIESASETLAEEIANIKATHINDTATLRDSISTVRSELEVQHNSDMTSIREEISNLADSHDEDMESAKENLRVARAELVELINTLDTKLEELKGTVTNHQNSSHVRFNAVEARVTALEEYKTNLSNNLDSLAKAIVKAFREYVSIDEYEIRDILDEFESNIMDEDIAKRTYEELVQYIKNEFITIKNALQELDKRVTILEIRTDPYIVDDSDIYAMFPELDRSDIAPDFDIDDYPVATEEDIQDMFTGESAQEPVTVESSIVSEGEIFDMFGLDPDEHTSESVQDILNNIATEEDILDMFGLDQSDYSSMEELLEAIKAKNTETDIIAEEATEEDIKDMFKDP